MNSPALMRDLILLNVHASMISDGLEIIRSVKVNHHKAR